MNAFEFEITILRKSHDRWPIVVRIKQQDGLTTHTEGNLQLSEDNWNKLTQQQGNEKEYGKLLGQALFRDEVRDAFIRAYSKSSQDHPLRILLSIEVDRTDELRTLHWQRLCAPIDASGEWNLLARDQRVPFSLYIPTIIDRRFPPIGRRDLRALVLVASPSNLGKYSLAPFDEKEVVKSVKLALGDIECKFLANIDDDDVVGPPTLEELSKQLTDAKKPYTLLHMVCHGSLMKDNQGDTVLFWATEDNQVKTVLGNDLVAELKNIGEQKGLPHLAFLCTCESADLRAEGALGGLGQRLVRNLGMPAVVAMTRKVTVKTALTLSKRFYERLRESGEVDSAMQEATAGLGDRSDITVPALFSRLAGLPLFSDRLEDRELTDGEIDYGIEQCRQLLQERAPNASVLKDKFEQQVRILQERRGSEIRSARLERQQALYELNILCNQVLEISFDALAALGKTPPQYKAECPFPGLSSFRDPKYRKFFFGRDELIKELHQKFKEGNFLAVFGESGSGKSSVVLAGLIPKLQQENPALQMVYLRPGSAPVEQLQVSQAQVLGQPAVFVVDQFEELFTLCTDEAQQQNFIDQLLQLVQQHKVAITIRSDFLGECSRYSALREQIEKRQKLVGPMEPSELGIAMKRQADTARLEFEEGLNNAILAEVEQERGRMPLLQYALQQLWERRWGRWLCYEEYEDLGGVNKAIATSADAFYRGLSSNDEQERVKNIFVRLTRLDENVQPGTKRRNTRRRVKLEELVPIGEDLNQTKELVKRLADEGIRLVVTSQDLATGAQEVEVAHEALIQHWNTLQEWLEKDRTNLQLREKISQAAQEWNQHLGKEEESYLVHRGEPLEQAKALSIQTWFFNQLEANYVNACVELRDRQRQEEEARQKRELEQERKALKAAQSRNRVAAISLVGLAGLTVFAFSQGNEAQKQKNEAQKNAREAARESVNALAQTSEANLSNKQLEAVVAAVEAGKKLKQAHLEDTTENQTVSVALQRVIYNVQELNRLAGHSDRVNSVSFSPDGKTLASASNDNTIKLWDVATGKQKTTLSGHSSTVTSVSFSPDGKTLASASWDHTIKLWDVATGKQKTTLKGHSDAVTSVSFSPDGKTLASASWDHTIKLWDVATGKQKTTLKEHSSTVTSVSFSPDGKTLASATDDNTIKLWDVDTGKQKTTLKGHSAPVTSVSFSPDGKTLAFASSDNTIKLWDLATGKQKTTLSGHSDAVNSVSFSPDGKTLASASDDKTIKLWDVATGKQKTTLSGHSDAVNSVSFSPDGKTLASASWDNTIKLWDVATGKQKTTLKGHSAPVTSVSFSPDGKTLASASWDNTIKVWDVDTGKQKTTLKGHSEWVTSVSFSPDGKTLASASNDKTIKLWDVDTGKQKTTLKGHSDKVISVSFSPDGKTLASASNDDTIKLWDVATGKQKTTFSGHSAQVNSVSFSPDGKTLASASWDHTIKLWDVATGKQKTTLKGHSSTVNSVGFSPDGKTLASASWDNTIKLWDVATGKQKTTLKGHSSTVNSVSFSPDGKTLASASDDKTIKLWDVATGQEKTTLSEHSDQVISVSFSPDGKTLASGSLDKTIKLWDVYPSDIDDLIRRNCDRIGAYLQTNAPVGDRDVCDNISPKK